MIAMEFNLFLPQMHWSFEQPVTRARAARAVSIDHPSEGRFELGVGWRSVPDEFATFGVGSTAPREPRACGSRSG